MSRSTTIRRLAVLLGSVAVVAACADSPTAPTAPLGRNARLAAMDSTTCFPRGWVMINGQVVCLPD